MRTHLSCPDCGHKDCLTEFDDGGTFCHSCHKAKKVSVEKIIESYSHDTSKVIRGIKQRTLEKYSSFNLLDKKGNPVGRVYPYSTYRKVRLLPKSFRKEKGEVLSFFGQSAFPPGGNRRLIITEGEEDAMASWQMSGIPSIAIPGSAMARKLIAQNKEFLDSFQKIILCLDNDDAGKSAENVFVHSFPGKVYRLDLGSFKDANQWLEEGSVTEYKNAVMNAKQITPDGVYRGAASIAKLVASSPSIEYYKTGFESLDEKIKGIPKGMMSIVTGQEGIGKTEFLRRLEFEALKNGHSIAIMHCEETEKLAATALSSYHYNKNMRLETNIDEFLEEYDERLTIMSPSIVETPQNLIDRIRFSAVVYGIEYFFIDPVQQLVYASAERNDTEESILSMLSVKMAGLASELNIGIVLTAHVNDDGQVRSSRMIAKSAAIRLDLVNRAEDDTSLDVHLSVTKNRPFSKRGKCCKIDFNEKTFEVSEGELLSYEGEMPW